MNENDRVSDSWEEEDRAAFQVGGVDRELSPEQQLEQLATYIHAHYEAPAKNPPWSDDPSDPVAADTFDARLPDRLTHSAMLMLGAAVEHSMPGVAFAQGVCTPGAEWPVCGVAASGWLVERFGCGLGECVATGGRGGGPAVGRDHGGCGLSAGA